ncbi:MAG: hypothetical protein K9G11_02450 [Rickettsiaceae bacterium]|nr:hypothetical protein [Rickettsiaceae bacterium]
MQARNDASTLPLEDVSTLILEWLKCLSVIDSRHHALCSCQRRYAKIMFLSSLGLIIC